MLNPINSNKIAKSVQRDYQQAAETHRLAKASKQQTGHSAKIVLTLTTLVTTIALISQYLV